MEQYNGLVFETFTNDDIDQLTGIMKSAFDEDAKRHLNEDEGGPPGYDNGDFMRQWYLHSAAESYKISKDGQLIGGISLFISDSNENYLGNIFVDPSHQDKGIGTIIWEFIEKKYSDTKIWRAETPGFSKRNHNYYVNKCGFKIVKIVNPGDKNEEMYILEKEM